MTCFLFKFWIVLCNVFSFFSIVIGPGYLCLNRDKKNGCLQVLKGSHRLGRINHILSGEQAGAEPDILDAAISQFSLEYVEMEPGDVLFFHCNLLHSR